MRYGPRGPGCPALKSPSRYLVADQRRKLVPDLAGVLRSVGDEFPHSLKLAGVRLVLGERINPAKLLIEPYARAVHDLLDYSGLIYGSRAVRNQVFPAPRQ